MSETMTAWEQDLYGPASGLRRVERPIPEPGPGEVLLRVRATGLNAGDVRIMRGDPLIVRAVFGIRGPRNRVRGMDVAGAVVARGADADTVRVGDEVVVELPGGGGLAEYAIAPVARLAARPDAVSAPDAACLPIAAGTAWQALDLAKVGDGHRVLILGASGGVGTFAVQLAALRGARVDATCSARNRTAVESLGATWIDRSIPPAELSSTGYDAVIEIASGARLRDLRRLVHDGGSVVLVGGDGGRMLGPIPRMLRAALLSVGSRRRIRSLAAVAKPQLLRELLGLVEVGAISPLIEGTYPFDEADAALAEVEAGHVVGKIVVEVG